MHTRPALVVALCAFAGAAVLNAHLAVLKSSPAADQTIDVSPKRLQIWFNEPPAAGISQITLTGPSGEIEVGKTVVDKDKSIAANLLKPLDNGSYVIAWRTAGDDGHPAKGEIKFKVAGK
jgi:methionine-rich copper-binding protein CopC